MRWCGVARRWSGVALRRCGGARVWWQRWLPMSLEVLIGESGDWARPLVLGPCWLCFVFCWLRFSCYVYLVVLLTISLYHVWVGRSGPCAGLCTLCALSALGRWRVPDFVKLPLFPFSLHMIIVEASCKDSPSHTLPTNLKL
ncbi:hypothetical protein RchiOBHm_Chr7g0204721 [Rosa chinensis]|uniref:Uncharacterized protein n=1 Tax=Rosa chinensis TaxID=74649 RepID=A0A2P6P8R9_ROSCH|nr:hypothetical protein RchiOBHm_Chr7g0204721 [Rosa chinensis]